jgi:intracellular septation protein
VGIFGGLTIWMQDEEFIKIKLTIINVLFGVVLLGGVAMGHSLLKSLLGQSLALSDEAWRSLTVRYALFFLATAGINEIVRRQVDLDTYVNFKVFGVLGLTVIFSLTQAPFLNRHIQRSGGGGTGSGSSPQI